MDLMEDSIRIAYRKYHRFVGMGILCIEDHQNPNIGDVHTKYKFNHSRTC